MRKNSQQKGKLSMRTGGKKTRMKKKEEEERDKEGKEKKKIKEHVCKLTLTAQQGAFVDRGER